MSNLSKAEIERLAILSEELGEVQQIIGKILRHGFYSFNPFDETETPNKRLLEKELGDVFFAVRLMTDNSDVMIQQIEHHAKQKVEKIKPYLHHQKQKA